MSDVRMAYATHGEDRSGLGVLVSLQLFLAGHFLGGG